MDCGERNSDRGRKRESHPSSFGFVHLRPLGEPAGDLICLRSDRVYTVGRGRRHCDLVLLHRCISNRHCQIFLDGSDRKLRLIDGFLFPRRSHIREIRRGFQVGRQCANARVSLNGVFVNGHRVRRGVVAELFFFSEVKIVRENRSLSTLEHGPVAPRSFILLSQMRSILASSDPVSYLRNFLDLQQEKHVTFSLALEIGSPASPDSEGCCKTDDLRINVAQKVVSSNANVLSDEHRNSSVDAVEIMEVDNCELHPDDDGVVSYSDGSTFFLNRLKPIGRGTSVRCDGVTLPELFHPVKTLLRVFIATFTCDVSWFLSCCRLPNHLPITIACHDSVRCWSACHDSRTSAPYINYPNLLLVYPPFPDVIAFGKDRKKKGVACHHPKLIVLQRDESLRVIVTSANLVPKQWDYVTNTVWWQDFPRRTTPDYSAFFRSIEDLKSDFAAQLAGFVASLIVDVPSQAHWVNELAKYNFGQAACHLVASLPGVHTQSSYYLEANYCLSVKQIMQCKTSCGHFLGSVQATVVGLSHRFHASPDPNGGQLKVLASLLGKCQENTSGMVEVLLKRATNIPADANAVSVVVAADLDKFSEGDSVQLGFLPRDVAKWLSPLSDIGFFSFSAFIYAKEALAAAFGGSSTRVQLCHVIQGPTFSEIPRLICPEHYVPLCSLVASVQRCLGLWRLREVLWRYKWPESLEVDFVYGSSSIGTSVNLQFFSAFSAAAGKKSCQYPDSNESDPAWGCWTSADELNRPSIKILFPTIETVKNGRHGIWDSRHLLSLSERTWQRLTTTGIFHDAIPYPCERLGYPMHVKVARRCFQSGNGMFSFGWIYIGSHNFSPAAWGNTLLSSSESKAPKLHICNYELGIILIVPPPVLSDPDGRNRFNLDDFVLPFVMPAPEYQDGDRPATAQAMREACVEVTSSKVFLSEDATEELNEDILDEEVNFEESDFNIQESEEEKIYAEMLWGQVDSAEISVK
ncbi:Tyrosyl-DNA phosphodiesterase [Musa troglodytarum]|uniref:Tyrosyl-DNA phosphodiesterase n=2 Tax=Musa troglodytarum TaxID=320322 RepID=A0A9E7IAB6_9LILI|nr:Tyrosyl-DNA phosphodiesterase [Musa troglodytarum]